MRVRLGAMTFWLARMENDRNRYAGRLLGACLARVETDRLCFLEDMRKDEIR